MACHQLGTKATREIPAALGTFSSTVAAWERRVQSGQAGCADERRPQRLRPRSARSRCSPTGPIAIAAGRSAAARRRGRRASSATSSSRVWDWADPKAYLHDVVSTDRRNPTVNADGPIYGALELSADYLPVLDPVTHAASRVPLTVRDPKTPPAQEPADAGRVAVLGRRADLDEQEQRAQPDARRAGPRLAHVARCGRPTIPRSARKGSSHPSAKAFPVERASRHLAMYDPKTKKLTHISTCFGTHHLMFAEDANNTLWTSGGGQVVGWLNTKMFDETGDEEASQGWTPLILDTNGNGRRDAYVEPNQPVDPTKDKRITAAASTPSSPAPTARSGARRSASRARSCGSIPGSNPSADGAGRGLRAAGRRPKADVTATRRAAWTSIATASCGSRWRAGTWRASIAASARGR